MARVYVSVHVLESTLGFEDEPAVCPMICASSHFLPPPPAPLPPLSSPSYMPDVLEIFYE